jgi:hypothetical protein
LLAPKVGSIIASDAPLYTGMSGLSHILQISVTFYTTLSMLMFPFTQVIAFMSKVFWDKRRTRA